MTQTPFYAEAALRGLIREAIGSMLIANAGAADRLEYNALIRAIGYVRNTVPYGGGSRGVGSMTRSVR